MMRGVSGERGVSCIGTDDIQREDVLLFSHSLIRGGSVRCALHAIDCFLPLRQSCILESMVKGAKTVCALHVTLATFCR